MKSTVINMKKYFIVSLLLIIVLTFIGCDGEQGTADITSTTQAISQSDETQEAPIEETTSNEKLEEISAEISKSAFQAWKNSIGTVWAHAAIEITNTGDTPIGVGDISISFVGEDNSILGSLTFILPVPEVLLPGEVSYAGDSTTLDGVDDPKQVKSIEANIDYDETDKEPQILEVQDLKITAAQYGGPKVTGRVKNTSQENADDIRVAIAMFDESDNLLGVYTESISVTLAPDKAIGFETSYPSIEVEGFEEKVNKMTGKSFNWKFDW